MTESLTFDQLSTLFHMPLSDAAKEIGICCTALKKACRKNNISRWPHRKIKSLDRMIETLEAKLKEVTENDELDKTAVELEYYKNQRALIMKNHQRPHSELKIKPSAISKPSQQSPTSPQVFAFKTNSPNNESNSASSPSSCSTQTNSPISLDNTYATISSLDFDLFPETVNSNVDQKLPLPPPSLTSVMPNSNFYFYPPPQSMEQKNFHHGYGPFLAPPQFMYNLSNFATGSHPQLPVMNFPHGSYILPFGYPVPLSHANYAQQSENNNNNNTNNNTNNNINNNIINSQLMNSLHNQMPYVTAPQCPTPPVSYGENPSSPNFVSTHSDNIYDTSSSFTTDFIFCQ